MTPHMIPRKSFLSMKRHLLPFLLAALALLGARLPAEESPVKVEAKPAVEKALDVETRLQSKDAAERMKAWEDLALAGDEKALARVEAAYPDAQGAEKGLLLSLMLKKGRTGLAKDAAAFRKDPVAETRMRVAYAARYANEPDLAREMLSWVKEDADDLVREYAAHSLAFLDDPKAAEEVKGLAEAAKEKPHLAEALKKSLSVLEARAATSSGNAAKEPAPK